MRNYVPRSNETWHLDPDRYHELKAFCRQYPKWLAEAKSALELSSPKMDGMPRGTDVSDPTERAVEQRERIIEKIDLVERCAKSIGDGMWYNALIHNVCLGWSYERIRDFHPEFLTTNKRIAFFVARSKFFMLLDVERK